MKFDFTTVLDRHGMDALSVDDLGRPGSPAAPQEGFDAIPMWIADMNFATAPAVVQGIEKRLQHPIFGYFNPRQEYYDAIISWQERRHGVTGLQPEHIGYSNGVLGGIISVISAVCPRGDKILVHSPTYSGFTRVLTRNGYQIALSPLRRDEAGIWRMDYADMEKQIVENKIHAAILCSPHNPSGRVWERWELEKAMELFKKYDVFVVSDEIWSDLILPGHKHIPTQSISDDARMRTAAMYSPSKGFNLAGMQGSYRIIYNKWLRDQTDKQAELCVYNEMNVMSMYALIGAYSDEGEQWLEELLQVLDQNIDYFCRYAADRFPGVTVTRPQGTYLLFPDFRDWLQARHMDLGQLFKACLDVGVTLQDGRLYHGDTNLRINTALPLSLMQEACRRLDRYVLNP